MIKKSTLTDVLLSQKEKINTNLGQTRNLLSQLSKKPSQFALIISGIRRCGKSTLLNQYITSNIKEEYCT